MIVKSWRIESRAGRVYNRGMKNVVLIGMPGCGKSTCGVLAAKALCKDFVDTDLVIQQKEKMPLQAIINEKGNDCFAAAEESAVCSLAVRNAVVATGGSVVYSQKAMERGDSRASRSDGPCWTWDAARARRCANWRNGVPKQN